MSLKKCLAVALIFASLSLAEAPHGTVPRSAAADYSAHAQQDKTQIGASLLTHKELKKVLDTDINQCCVVVEVAFYPAKDNFVKISLDDFMLRETGLEVGIRPSTPEVLAARLEIRPVQPDREHRPGVTSSSEVGYERTSGDNRNSQDPSRQSSRGGIYQRESVGVGVPIGGKTSKPEGAAAEGNRRAIEAELTEKGLPEISAWEPVAGYLYFSVPKKKKSYELVYMAGDKKIVLPLK